MIEDELNLCEQITHHQQKSRNTYNKIQNSIDKMIQLYESAQQSIKNGKDHHQVIQDLNRQLLNIKPIKTIREYQTSYYKKLSNLIKKVQYNENKHLFSQSRFSRKMKSQKLNCLNDQNRMQKKINDFFNQFIKKPQEIEAFDEIIVENYLRNGLWQCADVWPSIRKRIDPNNLFTECLRLKGLIQNGNFEQAIKWSQNEQIFKSHQNLIQYELHKLQISKFIYEKSIDEAIAYFRNNFSKFHIKQQEIQVLIGFILYKGKWNDYSIQSQEISAKIQSRFSHFHYTKERCLQLAQSFEQIFFKHNTISNYNILKTLYNCSQKISQDYQKMMKIMWAKQNNKKLEQSINILPFSVKINQPQYQYHSLFLCPITKQVQSGHEKSILLCCGHLISSSAYSRILQQNRGRRKIKCPVCQKDVNQDESMNISF